MFFRKISAKVLRSKEKRKEIQSSRTVSKSKSPCTNNEYPYGENIRGSGSITLTDMHSMPSSAGKYTAVTELSSTNDSALAADRYNLHRSEKEYTPFMRRVGSQQASLDSHTALAFSKDDDWLFDVTLVGRDNAKVQAVKSVLAHGSSALKKKLDECQTGNYIDFGEYGEHALRAMKEYCHTGDISSSLLCTQRSALAAEQLAELAILSEAYNLDDLYGKADHILCQLIDASPWFATAAYDALVVGAKSLEDYLFHFIQGKCPDLFLETRALKYLSHGRLSTFLHKSDFEEAENLRFLIKWIKEQDHHTAENISSAKRIASELVCLQKLFQDPFIVFEVTSSGLFDMCDVDLIVNGNSLSYPVDESSSTDADSSQENHSSDASELSQIHLSQFTKQRTKNANDDIQRDNIELFRNKRERIDITNADSSNENSRLDSTELSQTEISRNVREITNLSDATSSTDESQSGATEFSKIQPFSNTGVKTNTAVAHSANEKYGSDEDALHIVSSSKTIVRRNSSDAHLSNEIIPSSRTLLSQSTREGTRTVYLDSSCENIRINATESSEICLSQNTRVKMNSFDDDCSNGNIRLDATDFFFSHDIGSRTNSLDVDSLSGNTRSDATNLSHIQLSVKKSAKKHKKKKKKERKKKERKQRERKFQPVCYQLSINGDVCAYPVEDTIEEGEN